MLRRTPFTLVVCLLLSALLWVASAPANSFRQAAVSDAEDLASPPAAGAKDTPRVGGKPIYKVRPIHKVRPLGIPLAMPIWDCCLPQLQGKGWEADAEAMFARTKGRVRYTRSANYSYGYYGQQDLDFNGDLGLSDHNLVPSFSLRYRFRPNWSFRYSLMPMELNSSGTFGRNFWFGSNTHTAGSASKTQWQRLYHRAGLTYDPISTPRGRVSLFADYVRLDEKVTVIQVGCCGDTFDHGLNMAMAGIEFERCIRTSRFANTLSLECKAGGAFLDEAVGADLSTGLKYTISMGNGRWGYLGGGYRFVNYKKGYGDYKQIDTTVEGGYVKVGFIF